MHRWKCGGGGWSSQNQAFNIILVYWKVPKEVWDREFNCLNCMLESDCKIGGWILCSKGGGFGFSILFGECGMKEATQWIYCVINECDMGHFLYYMQWNFPIVYSCVCLGFWQGFSHSEYYKGVARWRYRGRFLLSSREILFDIERKQCKFINSPPTNRKLFAAFRRKFPKDWDKIQNYFLWAFLLALFQAFLAQLLH